MKKYLTIEKFDEWRCNEFKHLKMQVSLNTKLLWVLLGGLIVAAIIDKVV